MRAIFESLPGLMDELPNDEARQAIVFAVWPAVLGEHLRQRSAPQSFENAVISVAVTSADWKREFEQHAAELVYKLNRIFGKKRIARIELTVDAAAVKRVAGRIESGAADARGRLSAPEELRKVSIAIADCDLREHFLEAASACIKYRDSK